VLADSLVLRNPLLRQAQKRYKQLKRTYSVKQSQFMAKKTKNTGIEVLEIVRNESRAKMLG
jgi:hypothetical protein